MFVADGGREEFDETPSGLVAGVGDDRRQWNGAGFFPDDQLIALGAGIRGRELGDVGRLGSRKDLQIRFGRFGRDRFCRRRSILYGIAGSFPRQALGNQAIDLALARSPRRMRALPTSLDDSPATSPFSSRS